MATGVMCVSDIFSWTLLGMTSLFGRIMLEANNMIYYASITFICYAWLKYFNTIIGNSAIDNRLRMVVEIIPLAIMLFIILINPFTKLLFEIDKNGYYQRCEGVIIHWIISWGYLLISFIENLLKLKEASTQAERKQLVSMLGFIAMPVIGAIVQMCFYGVSAMSCGITLSILMIAIDKMQSQILSDSLTGLNNRRALENYVDGILDKKIGIDISVFMLDIDDFKKINDAYGHIEGDKALVNVANIFKKTCGDCDFPLFLCRYGGDEFLICGMDMKEDQRQKLLSIINKNVSEFNKTQDRKRNIGISVGMAYGKCFNSDDLKSLFRNADSRMYDDKKNKKENG